MMSPGDLEGLYTILDLLEKNGFGVPKDKIKLINYFLVGGIKPGEPMTEAEVRAFSDRLNIMISNGFSSLKDEAKIVKYVLGDGA